MGRKLIRRMPTEKKEKTRLLSGHAAIVACQHLLLLSSGYVLASTACLIRIGVITKDLLPLAVILLFSVRANMESVNVER